MTEAQAREIIKRISDSAIELAICRHDLESDSTDLNDPLAMEDIKSDILDCLTGDETGCNDPEDLDATNCELRFLEKMCGGFEIDLESVA